MSWRKELIVLGADEDVLAIARTLILQRAKSLGLRALQPDDVDFKKDVFHDSSSVVNLQGMLRGYQRTHHRAMVLRDWEGSGQESQPPETLEGKLEEALAASGWEQERVCAIVICPEVERWLRFDSPHLARLVKEQARRRTPAGAAQIQTRLGRIILENGGKEGDKPARPKEVFRGLLAAYGIPPSANLFEQLAAKESLRNCTVTSFLKFVETLQRCFPPAP
jgi:hypothetical protein